MALETNELFSSASRSNDGRIISRRNKVATLAAVSGAPTLKVGTPMAWNTSTHKWVPWASGGANGTGTVSAVLYKEQHTSATDEVLGVLMYEGEIHVDAFDLSYGSETVANLKAALKATATRSILIFVKGLADVA